MGKALFDIYRLSLDDLKDVLKFLWERIPRKK